MIDILFKVIIVVKVINIVILHLYQGNKNENSNLVFMKNWEIKVEKIVI